MTTTEHPSMTQLMLHAHGRGANDVIEHLRRCERCQRLVPSDLSPPSPTTLPDHRVSDALQHLLAAPVPDVVDPTSGELWRLEWDGEAVVAAISSAEPDTASVAAVDTEPREDDPEPAAVHVPASATRLATELRVWPAAPVEIPSVALDRRLAPPLRLPAPISELDHPESWGLQQALGRLRWFAGRVHRALADPGQPGSLHVWLRERGISRADLVAAGLAPRAASMVLQGRQQPSADDLLRIARALDADPWELRRRLGTVPGELLAELHLPHRRGQVSERAAAEGVPESQLRREAAVAIAAPRAARRQRGSAPPDWATLVDDFFAQ